MLNKVMLIGNLGNDPEVRTTSNGKQVANFRLATNERWQNAQGERQDRAEWHRIVAWSSLAELCGKYLKKGSRAYVEGAISTRSYDKDGQTLYTTEIVASKITFLDRKEIFSPEDSPAQFGQTPSANTSNYASSHTYATSEDQDDIPF